jgi:hypothetical protein
MQATKRDSSLELSRGSSPARVLYQVQTQGLVVGSAPCTIDGGWTGRAADGDTGEGR